MHVGQAERARDPGRLHRPVHDRVGVVGTELLDGHGVRDTPELLLERQEHLAQSRIGRRGRPHLQGGLEHVAGALVDDALDHRLRAADASGTSNGSVRTRSMRLSNMNSSDAVMRSSRVGK